MFIIISWDSGYRLWFHLSLDVNAQQPGPVDIVGSFKSVYLFLKWQHFTASNSSYFPKKSGEHSELSFKSTNCTRLCIQISAAACRCFPFLVSLTSLFCGFHSVITCRKGESRRLYRHCWSLKPWWLVQ